MNNEKVANYIEEDNEEVVEVIYKFSIFRKIIVAAVQIFFITMAILAFLFIYKYDPLKKAILVGLIITLDYLLSVILLDESNLKKIQIVKKDYEDNLSEELESKQIIIEDKIEEKNMSNDNVEIVNEVEEDNISNDNIEIIDEIEEDNISNDNMEIVDEIEEDNIPNDNIEIIDEVEEDNIPNDNIEIVDEVEEDNIPNDNIEIVEEIEEDNIPNENTEIVDKKEVVVKDVIEELSKNPHLLFYSGREIENVVIDKDVYVLGRLRGSVDYVIENLAVGRIHARIVKKDNKYYLEDFNSKNGTFLNGEKLLENETCLLKDSDEITLANVKMYFRI